jgi:hypothetical protein
MALELNTILIIIILGILIGILFGVRRIYMLERKMASLEISMAKKPAKRTVKKKAKKRR